MKEQWSAIINSFKNKEAQLLNHKDLFDDPDNETERPFLPTNMLPFAGDLGQNEILLELGGDQTIVWYWEDQPEAWGEGDNQILGFVADNLYDFINNLT